MAEDVVGGRVDVVVERQPWPGLPQQLGKRRSFLLDGEAVACDGDGVPVFDGLRYRRQDGRVFLYAFDLIEIEGMDLRSSPLEVRKAALLPGARRRPAAISG